MPDGTQPSTTVEAPATVVGGRRPTTTPPRLRVVQWGTGNVGRRSLREVVRHPHLELVGLRVHDAAKVGVDAGALCGEPPTGVLATDVDAEILALRPDCVLYMPGVLDLDAVCTLLAAGVDVVTTRGELAVDGSRLGPADRQRVLDACAAGRSSVHATGSSPGFITETFPLALLSLQRNPTALAVWEFADMSRRDSPQMVFDLMGFGRPPRPVPEGRVRHLLADFGVSLALLAQAAGWDVDTWRGTGDVAVARTDVTTAAGPLAAGTVGAQRTTIVGLEGGVERISFTACWYLTPDLDPAWDLGATGWRVHLDGEAPFALDLAFPIPLEDLNAWTPAYTANRPVNAVHAVHAARPGILSVLDLPSLAPAPTVVADA